MLKKFAMVSMLAFAASLFGCGSSSSSSEDVSDHCTEDPGALDCQDPVEPDNPDEL